MTSLAPAPDETHRKSHMAPSTVDAGLMVAIFLPTVGLCLIIALVIIYWAWRRRRLRRRIQLTADPPGPAMQRYIVRNGKLVPAPPPRESPSRLGWSTPRRLSRYLSGLSTNSRAAAGVPDDDDDDDVPAIPPLRESLVMAPTGSRPHQRTTAQSIAVWQSGKHGKPEEIPPLPQHASVVASQPKRASLRIKTSLLRASQLPPIMNGPDSARALPISPLSPERPNDRASQHHTSPVMHQRRNLSGHSFLDPPSEEVLRSFLDPPSDEQVQERQRQQQQKRQAPLPPSPPPPQPPTPPQQQQQQQQQQQRQQQQQQQDRQREPRSPPLSPHQSPPLPAYHSPLQSRFFVEPQFNGSRLSRHTSRHPSRVPSRNWASISSISQIQQQAQLPIRHSRPSPVSSLSETPPQARPAGTTTSPRSADTFFSESDSSNQRS